MKLKQSMREKHFKKEIIKNITDGMQLILENAYISELEECINVLKAQHDRFIEIEKRWLEKTLGTISISSLG